MLGVLRAVFISYWKTVPEGWGEEKGSLDTFENILWKLMGKEIALWWVRICSVCDSSRYFCCPTGSFISSCSSHATENPLQSSGLKQCALSLMPVHIGCVAGLVGPGSRLRVGFRPVCHSLGLAGCPGHDPWSWPMWKQAHLALQGHFKCLLISWWKVWTESQGGRGLFHPRGPGKGIKV